jgi:hypothetical protein
MYIATDAVVISNAINSGTGDSLRIAFGKINTAITSLGTYINANVPTVLPSAIAYLTANTVLTLGDSQTTLVGDLLPAGNLTANLGSSDNGWSHLYVGVVSTNDLTVNGVLVAFADGGSF